MNLVYISLAILLLIILNGVFASSEMALVTLSPSSIEPKTKKDKLLLKFINKPTRFLSTIQIGISFIGFLSGVLASDSYAKAITDAINPVNYTLVYTLFMIGITIVLVFLQVLFGELIPKRIAFAYPKKIAYAYIYLLFVIEIIFRPLVLLLTFLANSISRIFGVKKDENKEVVNEDEIINLLNSSKGESDITKEDVKLIENVFEFNDLEVKEIMTHRTKICGINIKWTKQQIYDLIVKEQYSRYPVYKGSIDHIVGVVNLKDLLPFFLNEDTLFDLKKVMKKPLYAPESQKIKTLLDTMRKKRVHIAVVIDEYSGTAGLISLEDIVEEVFGSIYDEFDDDEDGIVDIGNNEYIVDGLISINDLETFLGMEISPDDFDTLSGFILGYIGHLPNHDEKIEFEYNNLRFKVLEYENRIIKKVRIKKV